MTDHRSEWFRRRAGSAWCMVLVTVLLVAVALPLPVRGEPGSSPLNSLADARLRSIAFLDPDHGWAVGDRGVIWRTTDGGRHWNQQPSGVTCRLDCVHFIDPRHGWIVGGWSQAYSEETSGVVLRTTDGGDTWTRVPGKVLPALSRVRFFNAREGLAWGAATAMYPAGIFRTGDGGQSWQTMPPGPWSDVAAADFLDLQRGVIVSRSGEITSMTFGRPMPSGNPNLGLRRIRDVRLTGSSSWMVGDGGLVMQSDNGGAIWRTVENLLPNGGQSLFDFHAVAVWGPHCWIAGSPGSVVFHSPDNGKTWNRLSTTHTLPIDGLTFLNPERGWAVGPLGTILTTRDGGRTWWAQRSGGTRAALLGFFSEPQDAPFEIYAWYGGNEGYLGVAYFLNRREGQLSHGRRMTDRRIEESIVAVGGTAAETAWNFPLLQEGLNPSLDSVFAAWDRTNDGDGQQKLKEVLVRQIRIWRPDVIVTEEAAATADNPVAAHISRTLLAAIAIAEDPSAMPDHMTLAGLTPWQVSKVYGKNSRGTADMRLSSAQLAANLGAAVDDYAMRGRSLIDAQYTEAPKHWDFLEFKNSLPQQLHRQDFFAGMRLSPGSESRRGVGQPPNLVLEQLSRVAQQRRNMEKLISQSTLGTGAGSAWLGQLADMTSGLPPDASATVLFHLAMRYYQSGQSEMAAETLQRLISSCPDSDLADASLEWLVRYYSSSEISWRLQKQTSIQSHMVRPKVQPTFAAQPAMNIDVVRDTVSRTVAPHYEPFVRSAQALELAQVVARTRPTLFARPEFRFPIASAHQARGQGAEADSYFNQLVASALDDSWRKCAQTEQWLRHARGTAPKPIVNCNRAAARPHLDGELSDAVWQQARAVHLQSELHDDESWPAAVMLAYDDQFLYIGATCRRAPQEKYSAMAVPRQRDADLLSNDRLELLLDIDRDYSSFYRLVIDYRGWGADECCGDPTWDPQWFIARQEDAETWHIEAAIAWEQLVPEPPKANSAWAIGLQRVAPRTGFQSWSRPAAVEIVPQGMGLLIFQ